MNKNVGKHCYPTFGGHKLPDELEHPITVNVFLKGSDVIVDRFHQCGVSPNDITTISMILGLLAIYYVLQGRPILAAVIYLISYLFDCLDGIKARKFNQETEFGQFWDHLHDWTIFFGLLIAISIKYPMNKWWWLLLFATIVGTSFHLGLTEEFNTKCRGIDQPNNMLRICTYLSRWVEPDCFAFAANPEDEELAHKYCTKVINRMKATRWVADVNMVLFLAVYLIYSGLTKSPSE
jgi:phosphatidylglycerophosphate synthase